jgi:hypothetical protein
MTPALRLAVAWMIGALALAIGWRLYAVRDTERAAAAIPPTPVFVNDARHAITTALRARFPYERRYPPEIHDTSPVGPAYMGDPLEEIDNAELRPWVPNTRFFVTGVVSGCIGDRVLVSFKRGEDGDDVRFWIAGTQEGPARHFLAQFLGIDAPTAVDRRALSRAIAALVIPIGFDHVDLIDGRWRDHGHVRSERRHWRDVDVSVDANGRANRIAISYPVDIEIGAAAP